MVRKSPLIFTSDSEQFGKDRLRLHLELPIFDSHATASSKKSNAIKLFVFNACKGTELIVMKTKNTNNFVRRVLRKLRINISCIMLRPDFYENISMFGIFWGFLRTIIPSLPELPPLS